MATGMDPQRSEAARQQIADRQHLQGEERDNFRSAIKSLSAMLRINGLRAVYMEREPMKEVLRSWLLQQDCPISCPVSERDDAIQGNKSRAAYRQAHAEALLYSAWLKRWLRALMPDQERGKQ